MIIARFLAFFSNSTFLIMNHVQSLQQKRKLRFGELLRGGILLAQVVSGGFWVISDDFRWFAVLVVTPI